MTVIYATQNGNSADGSTWSGGVAPGAPDVADSNGKTVTITGTPLFTTVQDIQGTGEFVVADLRTLTGLTVRNRGKVRLASGAAVASVGLTTQAGAAVYNYGNVATKIWSSPYEAIGTSTWGMGGGSRDHLNFGNRFRIRQAGTIDRVKFRWKTDVPTAFYVTVWRKNIGGTYDRVGISEDLVSYFSANTTVTIDLASPIAGVQEGDFVGFKIVGAAAAVLAVKENVTSAKTHYASSASVTLTNFAWESQSSLTGLISVIETCHSIAPVFVAIGDSIIAGHPAHYAATETTATWAPTTTIAYQLSQLLGGVTYQNMGIGSEFTSHIAARIAADVTALAPQFALLEGGVNDIAGGTAITTFATNWTTILTAVRAANIVPVVLGILPWTNGTAANMASRDAFNAILKTLTATYGGIYVDADVAAGQNRAAGPVGNIWDIKTAYNSDGVHYNAAGHTAIAGAIYAAIAAALTGGRLVIDSGATLTNTGTITNNYRLTNNGTIANGSTGEITGSGQLDGSGVCDGLGGVTLFTQPMGEVPANADVRAGISFGRGGLGVLSGVTIGEIESAIASALVPIAKTTELEAIATAVGDVPTNEELAAALAGLDFTDALADLPADTAAAVWTLANAIDGKTPQQALRYLAAIIAGKRSGGGTGTETFLGLDGTTERVRGTCDNDGNRTIVVYDGA